MFHFVFFWSNMVQYVKTKKTNQHIPRAGARILPCTEKREGCLGALAMGDIWRHCGNGETTELLYCLLLFKHVYCFANVCQFLGCETCWNQWLESQSHKADLWNGENLTWPTNHYLLKTLVPLKWLVCCDVLVRKGSGSRIQHFRAASTVSRPSS